MNQDSHQESYPIGGNCVQCGTQLHPRRRHRYFCSDRCLNTYGNMFQGQTDNSFSLVNEITRLQTLIRAQTEQEGATTDYSTMLSFYEEVVERTSNVLKQINASALISEERQQEELRSAREEVTEMEAKLKRLLHRAAELKKENKMLRAMVKKNLSRNGSNELARAILGVEEGATDAEIKKAFRAKAKRIHPDREHGDADLFKVVTSAMNMLLKESK